MGLLVRIAAGAGTPRLGSDSVHAIALGVKHGVVGHYPPWRPSRKEVADMSRLTPEERDEIIRRRGRRSDGDGQVHRIANLEVHHKDRNPENNDPRNLRVLTKEEHDRLHARD